MTRGTPPVAVLLDTFGLTDIGRVRQDNQDHFLICTIRKQMEMGATSLPPDRWPNPKSDPLAQLLVVADGVGGSAGGAEASGATIQAVAAYATHTIRCFYTEDPHHEESFLKQLQAAGLECHATLRDARSRGDETLAGAGATTITLVGVVWPRAYVVQVGDSRFYLLHRHKLTQITKDQTVAQELVDQGILTQSRADRSPLRDVLSSAVGGSEAHPEVSRVNLEDGDTLLLCTDGLTRHVRDDNILAQLARGDAPESTAQALVAAALDGGGSDNVTVIVARPRPAE
jgi:PPM family protein phosphatase